MSELDVGLNGEPFDAPERQAGKRVERMKPNGAPEPVYGRDGTPLILPNDAGVEDLRRELVDPIEGKYRLKPVDEHNKTIPGAPMGYVYLYAPQRTATLTPPTTTPAVPASAGQTEIMAQLVDGLLTAMKEHTEMARMYVSQLPLVVNTFSGIARDPVLAARTPLVVPVVPESKPSDEPQDEDEDAEEAIEETPAEPPFNWPRFAMDMADRVAPHVGPAIAGLSATFGARWGAQRAKAAPATEAPAATAPSDGADRLDFATMLHLKAIRDALAPEEGKLAMLMAEEFPPEQRNRWIEKLRPMSVPEAVEHIRQQMAEARAEMDARTTAARPPSAPSAARAARSAARVPSAAPAPTAAPRVASRTAPEARRGGQAQRGAATAAPNAAAVAPGSVMPAPAPSAGRSLFDADTQSHLVAIENALTPKEGAAMRARLAELSQADRAGWIAAMLMLPVSDAVATIRAELGRAARVPDAAPRNLAEPMVNASAVRAVTAAPAAELPVAELPVAELVAELPAAELPMVPTIASEGADTVEPVVSAPSAARPAIDAAAMEHLNAIESALAPEDRARVREMVGAWSLAEQDAWLAQLLAFSVPQGAEAIRHVLAIVDDGQDDGQELDELDDGQDDGQELDDGAPNAPADVADTSGMPSVPEVSAGHGDRAPQPNGAGPVGLPAALPLLDPAAIALFNAINSALTLSEKLRAHELAAQLPAGELRRWADALLKLPVPEAVARIRAALAALDTQPTSTMKGGVS